MEISANCAFRWNDVPCSIHAAFICSRDKVKRDRDRRSKVSSVQPSSPAPQLTGGGATRRLSAPNTGAGETMDEHEAVEVGESKESSTALVVPTLHGEEMVDSSTSVLGQDVLEHFWSSANRFDHHQVVGLSSHQSGDHEQDPEGDAEEPGALSRQLSARPRPYCLRVRASEHFMMEDDVIHGNGEGAGGRLRVDAIYATAAHLRPSSLVGGACLRATYVSSRFLWPVSEFRIIGDIGMEIVKGAGRPGTFSFDHYRGGASNAGDVDTVSRDGDGFQFATQGAGGSTTSHGTHDHRGVSVLNYNMGAKCLYRDPKLMIQDNSPIYLRDCDYRGSYNSNVWTVISRLHRLLWPGNAFGDLFGGSPRSHQSYRSNFDHRRSNEKRDKGKTKANDEENQGAYDWSPGHWIDQNILGSGRLGADPPDAATLDNSASAFVNARRTGNFLLENVQFTTKHDYKSNGRVLLMDHGISASGIGGSTFYLGFNAQRGGRLCLVRDRARALVFPDLHHSLDSPRDWPATFLVVLPQLVSLGICFALMWHVYYGLWLLNRSERKVYAGIVSTTIAGENALGGDRMLSSQQATWQSNNLEEGAFGSPQQRADSGSPVSSGGSELRGRASDALRSAAATNNKATPHNASSTSSGELELNMPPEVTVSTPRAEVNVLGRSMIYNTPPAASRTDALNT
ncbi:unnamed protein product [Amoebophrya sp. A25]|nr:unnamed protein product [Amoebophrya sp. A25]|eukprot:GSA25T00018945001.1